MANQLNGNPILIDSPLAGFGQPLTITHLHLNRKGSNDAAVKVVNPATGEVIYDFSNASKGDSVDFTSAPQYLPDVAVEGIGKGDVLFITHLGLNQ